MTDQKKVRITFTDADGREVSASMWASKTDSEISYACSEDIEGGLLMTWNPDDPVTVERIRELPTGLGAVVEFATAFGDTERCVYIGEVDPGDPHVWFNVTNGVTYEASEISENFTVLSEGIEL